MQLTKLLNDWIKDSKRTANTYSSWMMVLSIIASRPDAAHDTIFTTSSSDTTWLKPTLCGTCFALAPHTKAYLKVSFIVLWIWSQTSSIELLCRTINASLKSGSMPRLQSSQHIVQGFVSGMTYRFVYSRIRRSSFQHLSTTSLMPRSSSQLMTTVLSSRASLSRKSRLMLSILLYT